MYASTLRKIVRPRERTKTLMLQLSTKSNIVLLQVERIRVLPPRFIKIMEDGLTVKVGMNIVEKAEQLRQHYGVQSLNLVDLNGVARQYEKISDPDREYTPRTLEELLWLHLRSRLVPMPPYDTAKRYKYANVYGFANNIHSQIVLYKNLMKQAGQMGVDLDPTEFTYHPEPAPSPTF
ncbi:hypothetical protein FA95DRAFT_1610002 [Auriscalpium vulgare]|uniref:Uncharacterized protein n=1 Tax=Auriscalpium vulgare TaxID=40419 RepID=A0ACB8RG59_9AGAM|nr:hypothetical protein FA95DRAFT_1610002 [Auriscalpium vulgare]